ncbi:isocitrate dehydrogenase [NAD] subunit gamma, mitochondrial-like [Atheta coriaria]|uniref:isocitrate dehydrogenase [NAD] subunit gamma, mitochondrial-like n=1 Tax=Dalotia coriaria TaxID=877792 RepID=UPI0031F37C00
MLSKFKRMLISRALNYDNKRGFKNIHAPPEVTTTYVTARYKLEETLPVAKYGGRYIVTMIPGDGIGKEIMAHIRDIFYMICAPIDFEVIDFDDPTDIDYIVHSARRNQCAIKGHMERWYNQKQLIFDSPNVELRKKLNLFAYITRFQTFKGVNCKFPDVDIVLVRQNTEGEYAMLEHETIKGVVNSLKVVSRKMVLLTAEYAMEYAKNHGRKKITVIHKANVQKLTDGLFRDVCFDLGKRNNIEMEELIIDNAACKLVQNPYQFDMLLCPNLYGNIITSIICGLIGGSGLTSAGNYGSNCAVFEPACRCRAKSLQGLNLANPTAFINAGMQLLHHLGFRTRAELLGEALRKSIEDDLVKTKDIGGTATTSEFIDNFKKNIARLMEEAYAKKVREVEEDFDAQTYLENL